MKIAVDILSIRADGSAGGATGFAIELIKGFARTEGVQVMVLCADWNIQLLKQCLPDNIQFCQVVGDKKAIGIEKDDEDFGKGNSRFWLAKNNVDILFCPFSAATFKEKGIPTVCTILDIQHEYYPQFFTPQELQHRRNFYRDIVKKVERVICISDYTKETFCEKYGYPLERAETVYIAIQNRFDKEDDHILDKLQVRGEKYIVYPANFWEHKNHKMLLSAFAMYAKEHRDMKLVLTGNPLEQSEYYNELLKEMAIDDLVTITGYVTNEELYSVLKNAKGLIYPSLFEGFGIPVVEAMHLHKLIACSNLTSLPEVGCDAIFYFNPQNPDSILEGIHFLAEKEVTEDITAEYTQKLKDFETDKMVNAYLDVFKDVISRKEDLIFEEGVEGIYPDGWSEASISIMLKERKGYCLKAILTLPEFVGIKTKVTVRCGDKEQEYQISAGESIEIEEPITENKAEIEIDFSDIWIPQIVLKSEDSRELAAMVERLEVYNDYISVDLLHEGNSDNMKNAYLEVFKELISKDADLILKGEKEDTFKDEIEKTFNRVNVGRVVETLCRLYTEKQTLEVRLRESEADRAARLDRIKVLEKSLAESEADRAARLVVIESESRRLDEQEELIEEMRATNELLVKKNNNLNTMLDIYLKN